MNVRCHVGAARWDGGRQTQTQAHVHTGPFARHLDLTTRARQRQRAMPIATYIARRDRADGRPKSCCSGRPADPPRASSSTIHTPAPATVPLACERERHSARAHPCFCRLPRAGPGRCLPAVRPMRGERGLASSSCSSRGSYEGGQRAVSSASAARMPPLAKCIRCAPCAPALVNKAPLFSQKQRLRRR